MELTSRAKLTGRALTLALACAGLEPAVPLLPGSSARARPIVAIENPVRNNDVKRRSEAIRFPLCCCRGGYSKPETVVRSSHRNDKDDGALVGSVARVCSGVMNAEASRSGRLEVAVLRGKGRTEVVGPQAAGKPRSGSNR